MEEDKKEESKTEEVEELKNNLLKDYVLDRVINKNKNFVIIFVGPTGSGKSYSALRFGELVDPTFNIDRVNFKARSFMETINNLVARAENGEQLKGRCIMWDEFGVEHNVREFMTISNRVINYFFQTSRHLNLIVIMTVPLLSFIDSATRKLCHAIAEMQGIDSKNKTANVKIKMLQVNSLTGKEYPKYLRYRYNGKTMVSKKLWFKLPSREILEPYERKKKEFTTGLNIEIMKKLSKDDPIHTIGPKPLTESEIKVGKLLLEHSAREVAEILDIDERSVFMHKLNISKKGYKITGNKGELAKNSVISYKIEGFERYLTNLTDSTTQNTVLNNGVAGVEQIKPEVGGVENNEDKKSH